MKLLFSVLYLLSITTFVRAQDCEVLTPALKGKYTGDCKNKKANGTGKAEGEDTYEGTFKSGYPAGIGTYIYKNGDYYTGSFKSGLKDGEGEFHYKRSGADSVVKGFWKKDIYGGAYATPYVIIKQSEGISRLNVREDGGTPGKITIVSENVAKANSLGSNTPHTVPVVRYFNVDEGSYQREERAATTKESTFILYGVQYPLKARISYDSETFEVLISKPGAWKIDVQIITQ